MARFDTMLLDPSNPPPEYKVLCNLLETCNFEAFKRKLTLRSYIMDNTLSGFLLVCTAMVGNYDCFTTVVSKKGGLTEEECQNISTVLSGLEERNSEHQNIMSHLRSVNRVLTPDLY